MNYFRSFPQVIPPYRRYVVDELPKLTIRHADLRTATEGLDVLGSESFTLLEWDIVVEPCYLAKWEAYIAGHPDEIVVAPYVLYPISTGHPAPMYAHTTLNNGVSYMGGQTAVMSGDRYCDFFSFGMIYFPWVIWSNFLKFSPGTAWNDTEFSIWHWEYYKRRQTRILWEVRTVHLHW